VVMKFSLLSWSFLLVRVAKSSVLATFFLLNGPGYLRLEENILWDVPRSWLDATNWLRPLLWEG
jgi:hypothetical protein